MHAFLVPRECGPNREVLEDRWDRGAVQSMISALRWGALIVLNLMWATMPVEGT